MTASFLVMLLLPIHDMHSSRSGSGNGMLERELPEGVGLKQGGK